MDFQQTLTITLHQLSVYLCIAELLLAVPLAFILKRLGYNPLWAVLSFVPALGIVALWLLAFIRWPRDAKAQ